MTSNLRKIDKELKASFLGIMEHSIQDNIESLQAHIQNYIISEAQNINNETTTSTSPILQSLLTLNERISLLINTLQAATKNTEEQ